MKLRGRFLGGLGALFRKRQTEQELNEEIRDYLENAVAEKMAAGMAREQALRMVRLEMGSTEVVKDQVRDQGWESIAESVARDLRYGARMLTRNPGFSLVVVLTLALGIGAYGLLSNAVNQRRQEIGVRMALGATPGSILRWVLQQAMGLTLVGGVLGIAGGLVATRFMASLLYGVTAADGASFVYAWALMTLTALLASYLPARRASRLDPTVTLRCE